MPQMSNVPWFNSLTFAYLFFFVLILNLNYFNILGSNFSHSLKNSNFFFMFTF